MGLIGCHISIAGGVEKSPGRAERFDCEAMQIFSANQIQWNTKPVSKQQRDIFLSELKKHKIQKVVVHHNYLTNLGGVEPEKLEKSRKSFLDELIRSDFLEIPYIVFHPGSHLGQGEDSCLKQIAENLDRAIEAKGDLKATLLLENTAGQGSNVGYRFEHLQKIIEFCSYPEKLGVCFDTCHAFVAGYDLRSKKAYFDTFKKFDDIIGLDRLKVFHLNDSKNPLNSRKDRHDNIGKGYIGAEPFIRLMNDDRFADCPMLLETPNGDEYFAAEILLLKNSVKS